MRRSLTILWRNNESVSLRLTRLGSLGTRSLGTARAPVNNVTLGLMQPAKARASVNYMERSVPQLKEGGLRECCRFLPWLCCLPLEGTLWLTQPEKGLEPLRGKMI